MKDWLLSKLGDWLVGHRISPYGKMTSFHIDTKNKRISATADLNGETAPISLDLGYERIEIDGIQHIRVTEVHVSREWMNDLAHTMLTQKGQTFPVPDGLLSTALKILGV